MQAAVVAREEEVEEEAAAAGPAPVVVDNPSTRAEASAVVEAVVVAGMEVAAPYRDCNGNCTNMAHSVGISPTPCCWRTGARVPRQASS